MEEKQLKCPRLDCNGTVKKPENRFSKAKEFLKSLPQWEAEKTLDFEKTTSNFLSCVECGCVIYKKGGEE